MTDRGAREESALRVAESLALELGPAEIAAGGHREAGHRLAVGLPGVDVDAGRVDDLRDAVAVEVGDHGAARGLAGGRPPDLEGLETRGRAVAGCGDLVPGVDWPSRQLRPVGTVRVDRSVLGRDDQLLTVVPVEVRIADRRFPAGANSLRIAGAEAGVLRRGEDAAVHAGGRDRLAVDHEANGELVLVRIRLAGSEGGPA